MVKPLRSMVLHAWMVHLSWGRWRWPTGSASCTPDTSCSSSSASWRRHSRKLGVQFVHERCSRSSAATDIWDTGPGKTRAAATPLTRYAPGRGWQRLTREQGLLVRVPVSRGKKCRSANTRMKAVRVSKDPGRTQQQRGWSLTTMVAFLCFSHQEHQRPRSPNQNLQETQSVMSKYYFL